MARLVQGKYGPVVSGEVCPGCFRDEVEDSRAVSHACHPFLCY
jgi:hypothetical protein